MTEIHERVLIDINDGIAAITLKWLEALNAVDTAMDEALPAGLSPCERIRRYAPWRCAEVAGQPLQRPRRRECRHHQPRRHLRQSGGENCEAG